MKVQSFDEIYKESEGHDEYWIAGAVQEFTEEIFGLMEREGVTRSELARRLGTSPSYITKVLRGNANFTLATMVRLAKALGAELRLRLTPVASRGRDARLRAEPGKQKSAGHGRRSTPLAAAAS